jgi:hypothetical protein
MERVIGTKIRKSKDEIFAPMLPVFTNMPQCEEMLLVKTAATAKNA